MTHICELTSGRRLGYDACSIERDPTLCRHLRYIGRGKIYSVDGIRQHSEITECFFKHDTRKTLHWSDRFHLRSDGVIVACPPITSNETNPLELSIGKWRFTVKCLMEGKEVRHGGGTTTCALCHRYHHCRCNGCPIYRFTKRPYCKHTPIEMWDDLKTLVVAEAELSFLVALREYYR